MKRINYEFNFNVFKFHVLTLVFSFIAITVSIAQNKMQEKIITYDFEDQTFNKNLFPDATKYNARIGQKPLEWPFYEGNFDLLVDLPKGFDGEFLFRFKLDTILKSKYDSIFYIMNIGRALVHIKDSVFSYSTTITPPINYTVKKNYYGKLTNLGAPNSAYLTYSKKKICDNCSTIAYNDLFKTTISFLEHIYVDYKYDAYDVYFGNDTIERIGSSWSSGTFPKYNYKINPTQTRQKIITDFCTLVANDQTDEFKKNTIYNDCTSKINPPPASNTWLTMYIHKIDVWGYRKFPDTLYAKNINMNLTKINLLPMDSCLIDYSIPIDTFYIKNTTIVGSLMKFEWFIKQDLKEYNISSSVSLDTLTNGEHLIYLTISCTKNKGQILTTFVDAYNIVTTDYNESLQNSIDIFPNPTSQKVAISFKSAIKVNSFEIYNTVGQLQYSKQTNESSIISESIDISRLIQGVYVIKVYTDKGTLVKKIIKN